MYKMVIISRSTISGEHTTEIRDEDLSMFYAQVVGAVQGLTAAGAVIVSVARGEDDA